MRICPWRGDKRWVYSITFDEALSELHDFAVPILEEYGVPGHLEVLVGQMGRLRNTGRSSYDGFRHMGPEELREMVDRGWGVGNHSWSHTLINPINADREIGEAKEVLEEAVGVPVTVYCAPGSNVNMNAAALEACLRYGYSGALSISDDLNRPGDENPLWLNRTFLHHEGIMDVVSRFDPFRRLHQARCERGWVIDYLHCPLPQPVHPRKDCSADQLRQRLAAVAGENDVWPATVEDPLDYRYTARAARVETVSTDTYRVLAPGLSEAVRRRIVTVALPPGVERVDVDGVEAPAYAGPDGPLVDLDLCETRVVRLV
jgi:peptidoglycan/xylan/chitin deacetylase (PgdA/CDA1 family)